MDNVIKRTTLCCVLRKVKCNVSGKAEIINKPHAAYCTEQLTLKKREAMQDKGTEKASNTNISRISTISMALNLHLF